MVLISCLSTYLSEPLGNYWGMILEQFGDSGINLVILLTSALLAFPILFNVFPSFSLCSALFSWEREPPCSARISSGVQIVKAREELFGHDIG